MSERQAFNKLARNLVNHISTPPTPRHVHLLYADKALIVINKPAGLVCQSNKTWEEKSGMKSSFDVLLEDLKAQFELGDVPKQVHRLDKYTTGAYLLAKSGVHARSLFQQFRDHRVQKTYLAIVRGGRQSFPDIARGTINTPLRVQDEGTVVDVENGKVALTDWELLGSSEKVPLSLVRLTLHSGMKHQLRVHLAQTLQAPILGDVYYSTKAPPQSILDIIPKGVHVSPRRMARPKSDEIPTISTEEEKASRRLFLHSAHVDITRYRSTGPKKRLTLGVSAPLPRYFVNVCKAAELSQYVPSEYILGGLSVDGEPVALDEEITGLNGRWLGPPHQKLREQVGQ